MLFEQWCDETSTREGVTCGRLVVQLLWHESGGPMVKQSRRSHRFKTLERTVKPLVETRTSLVLWTRIALLCCVLLCCEGYVVVGRFIHACVDYSAGSNHLKSLSVARSSQCAQSRFLLLFFVIAL